ncbi:hypothetical protein D3C72_2254000 [compost metagenome]
MNNIKVPKVTAPIQEASTVVGAKAFKSWKFKVPKVMNKMNIPSKKAASPIRLVMNAFIPAAAFSLSVNQKPISKYEQRPTPSQPTNITSKLSPRTSNNMLKMNRFR